MGFEEIDKACFKCKKQFRSEYTLLSDWALGALIKTLRQAFYDSKNSSKGEKMRQILSADHVGVKPLYDSRLAIKERLFLAQSERELRFYRKIIGAA